MTSRPDIPIQCPRGHQLWWFKENMYGRWAICSSRRCKYVWGWVQEGEKRQMVEVPEFNPVELVHTIRDFGRKFGYYDEPPFDPNELWHQDAGRDKE